MKPLFLLLAFGLIFSQTLADVGVPGEMCPGGFGGGQAVKRNEFRRDICDGETGKTEIYKCTIPYLNKTIRAPRVVQEKINGVLHVYKCVEFATDGVRITHTSAINIPKVDPPKEDGACHEGEMMFITNMQWNDGDFVKRCDPDNGVEIVACRSPDGKFVPLNSNVTEKRRDDETGSIELFTECLTLSNSIKIKHLITFDPSTGNDTTVSSNPACDNGKKLEEEWEEKPFIKTCQFNKPDVTDVIPIVAVKACVVDGVAIPVGGGRYLPSGKCSCTRSDGETDSAVKSATYHCIPPPTPVSTKIPSTTTTSTERRTTIRRPETPFNCSIAENVHKEWVENHFIKACKYIRAENGKMEIVAIVLRCIISSDDQIPVGGHRKMKNGGVIECRRFNRTEAKTFATPGSNSLKCENGKNVNETWQDETSVYRCVRVTGNGEPGVILKACIFEEVVIPLGETRQVASGRCSCDSDVATPNGMPHARVGCVPNAEVNVPASVTAQPTTRKTRPPPKCPGGHNAGEEWVDGDVVFVCNLRTRKILKQTITFAESHAIRCITPEKDQIPVGENKKTDLGVYTCTQWALSGAKLRFVNHGDTQVSTTTSAPLARCSNGRPLGGTWKYSGMVFECVLDERVKDSVKTMVAIKACIFLEVVIPIGEERKTAIGSCRCNRLDDQRALPECTEDPAIAPKPTELINKFPTNGRSGVCTYPEDLTKEWIVGESIISCKMEDIVLPNDKSGRKASIFQLVASRCITKEGLQIPIGQNKTTELGVYKCVENGHTVKIEFVKSDGTTDPTTPAPTCDNGLLVGQVKEEKQVSRYCHRDLRMVATHCRVSTGKIFGIGQIYRENAMQYTCEKRGQFDAQLVVVALQALCLRGDTTVDTWIHHRVQKDCVRGNEKPTIVARSCVLDDGRIIEIGQTITDEFITYICKPLESNGAGYSEDWSRVHPDYKKSRDTCMNGKKVGDEWTEKGVRRFCIKGERKGARAEIFDFGCELPDGRVISVGTKAKWEKEWDESAKNIPEENFHKTLYCEKGKPGFGAMANLVEFEDAKELRYCENGRHEREEWIEHSVRRTCKEVDDKMTVVALNCIVGFETMEIGGLKKYSGSSKYECARHGAHDAVLLTMPLCDNGPEEVVSCENGRNINDVWTEGDYHKSCRFRFRNKATIVVLGCLLPLGRVLAVGESYEKRYEEPEYENIQSARCVAKGDDDAELIIDTGRNEEKQDENSPCGENKRGEVWVNDHFIKKCKLIEGNILSGVTIGCITFKNTHMLEGEVMEEDDYNIRCHRNEDGKMELHYAFTLTEQ